MVCVLLMKLIKKKVSWKYEKSLEPFGSYLLNSTANPVHFHPNWAGLAVLFSQPLLNGCQDFFCCFDISIFIYLFEYKIIETKAPEFLAVNISVVGVH